MTRSWLGRETWLFGISGWGVLGLEALGFGEFRV